MDRYITQQMTNQPFIEKVERLGRRKPQSKFEVIEALNESVKRILVSESGKKYIIKSSSLNNGIVGIAASRMYNQIGLYTPIIHPFERKDKNYIVTVQTDIMDLDGIDAILASDNMEYLMLGRIFRGHDKWQIFYDTDLRRAFLKFMTLSCLEQLGSKYLVGELHTEIDSKLDNFILARPKGAEKYEFVISIDIEEMMITQLAQSGESFSNFLVRPYYSVTPQQSLDCASYRNRLDGIKELLQDGVLTPGNIDALRKATNYDLPKEIEQLCSQQYIYGRTRKNIVDPVKRLWDYNYENLEKEF